MQRRSGVFTSRDAARRHLSTRVAVSTWVLYQLSPSVLVESNAVYVICIDSFGTRFFKEPWVFWKYPIWHATHKSVPFVQHLELWNFSGLKSKLVHTTYSAPIPDFVKLRHWRGVCHVNKWSQVNWSLRSWNITRMHNDVLRFTVLGYNPVITIPAGATMINVTEIRRSKNYLGELSYVYNLQMHSFASILCM